ncbi:MAG: DUF479 domain-containing protein [Anaerolineae bacterium]|nr:DUF479 domain-containing protein [Anaerolineae bacterium]
MNYLAHLFISGDDPLLRIGNLAGDFVKGIDTTLLNPTMQQGITLHQSIDAYTDRHEIVQQSKRRIASTNHFAGIFVDVFYDHFLAVNWRTYGDRSLEAYASEVYADLQTHRALLPPSLQAIAARMRSGDWLTSYRDIEGIERALHRIEWRFGGKFDLASGIDELEKNYTELEGDFRLFFPELVGHAQAYIEQMRDDHKRSIE